MKELEEDHLHKILASKVGVNKKYLNSKTKHAIHADVDMHLLISCLVKDKLKGVELTTVETKIK